MNSISKLVGCQYISLEVNRKGHNLTSYTEFRKRNISCAHHPAIDIEEQTFCLHKACTDFGMRHPMDPRNRDDSNNCRNVRHKQYFVKGDLCSKIRPSSNRMTHNSDVRLKATLEKSGNSSATLFIKFAHVHMTNTHNAERWRPQLYRVSRIFAHAHWKWVTRDFESATSRSLNVTAPHVGCVKWAMHDFHKVTTVYDLALRDGCL